MRKCSACRCWLVKAAHTCSWKKVVPVLVEGHSHDAVSQVKGFLHAITMVNVYVDVENPRMVSVTHTGLKRETSAVNARWRLLRCVLLLEKLQYTDDDVIDVTKPRCLQKRTKLISVLQPFTNELRRLQQNRMTPIYRTPHWPQTFWHDANLRPSWWRCHRSAKQRRIAIDTRSQSAWLHGPDTMMLLLQSNNDVPTLRKGRPVSSATEERIPLKWTPASRITRVGQSSAATWQRSSLFLLSTCSPLIDRSLRAGSKWQLCKWNNSSIKPVATSLVIKELLKMYRSLFGSDISLNFS